MFLTPLQAKRDATAAAPKTARTVLLHGIATHREGLETAWLLLQERGDSPDRQQMASAFSAMRSHGWEISQAVELVQSATGWTGVVVHECANCPCN